MTSYRYDFHTGTTFTPVPFPYRYDFHTGTTFIPVRNLTCKLLPHRIAGSRVRFSPKAFELHFSTLVIKSLSLISFTVADIPGLIEGAHLNKGLGHSFLRHIERCRCLLYVIDFSLEDPAVHLKMLKNELDMYKSGLSSLPAAVVANKIDIPRGQCPRESDTNENEMQLPLIRVSGKYGTNIDNLKIFIRRLYEKGKD